MGIVRGFEGNTLWLPLLSKERVGVRSFFTCHDEVVATGAQTKGLRGRVEQHVVAHRDRSSDRDIVDSAA